MPGRDATRSTVQSRRVLAAVAVLAIVWVGVYWATPPAPQPVAAITFDQDRPAPPPHRPAVDTPIETVEASPTTNTPTAPAVVDTPPDPQVAVIPPAFRERIVRAGDTMESIAKVELGDAAAWTIVASANPRVDPMKLRAGMTLRIPLDPSNIQGKPNPSITTGQPRNTTPANAESTRIEYIVRPNDTLGGIARTYYNSAARWRVILDANQNVLTRPEELRPGMKLVIPPAPAGD